MTPAQRELMAKTLMAEAGGEGYGGMLAAGAVIDNRRKSGGYGTGFDGVIMKPGQFSAWNKETGYAGGEGGLNMGAMRPSAEAYRAADAILSGSYADPTGGATHYYNPAVATPKWGKAAGGNWQTIGNHIFGMADAGRGGQGPAQQPRAPQMATAQTAAPPMSTALAQPELTFSDKVKGIFNGTYKPDTAKLSDGIAAAFAPPAQTMEPAQFQARQGYQAPDRISKLYAMMQGMRGQV